MSDTPRTDFEESIQTQRFGGYMVKADFARSLERENAAMREAIKDAFKELQNIAEAKPHTWGDMSDQFQPWAQNRARFFITKLQPFLKP